MCVCVCSSSSSNSSRLHVCVVRLCVCARAVTTMNKLIKVFTKPKLLSGNTILNTHTHGRPQTRVACTMHNIYNPTWTVPYARGKQSWLDIHWAKFKKTEHREALWNKSYPRTFHKGIVAGSATLKKRLVCLLSWLAKSKNCYQCRVLLFTRLSRYSPCLFVVL